VSISRSSAIAILIIFAPLSSTSAAFSDTP
jgi:hypothetical protein